MLPQKTRRLSAARNRMDRQPAAIQVTLGRCVTKILQPHRIENKTQGRSPRRKVIHNPCG